MDKHYPLKLIIFSYENPDEFKAIFEAYEKRTADSEDIIEISREKEISYLKDNIFIQKNPIETYIELIISSINELDYIIDKSQSELSSKCLKLAGTDVKNKIREFSKNIDIDQIDRILPELVFLNKIKIEIEIESGVLFCEKCNRWFPIIETIPQMLPDEYREERKEIEWIQSKKNLLDETFLNQDLKPFKI